MDYWPRSEQHNIIWAFATEDGQNNTSNDTESITEKCYEDLGKNPSDNIHELLDLDAHKIGWLISGLAALIATVISFYLIIQHSRYYTVPKHQRYIIRIILLVPIYAIISWLSYIFYRQAIYYELIRDAYEAFVIASFFILLVHYVGDSPEAQHGALARREERLRSLPPFCCFHFQPSSPHFLQFLKYGILQYVVIRPLTTIAAIIMQSKGVYCPENYNPGNGHIYVTVINFASVTIAMYCLLMLYFSLRRELAPYSPGLKFWCVKLVIFFCFWQQIILSILGHFKVIKPTTYWTTANISTGLQAILVCFEMIVFAFLHIRAFPYAPYMPGGQEAGDRRKPKRWWKGIVKALNPWDFVREIYRGIHYLVTVLILRRPAPYVNTQAPVQEKKPGAEHEEKRHAKDDDEEEEEETNAHGMDLQRAVTGISNHHLPRNSLEMESTTFPGDTWSDRGTMDRASVACQQDPSAHRPPIQTMQPEARPPMQDLSEKGKEDVEFTRHQ
ncbi:MAG: organic solute transporter Ostalpha-domain-containing protein [Piptocephalis tieghemiana]|nr:MAG: organic solute transporter Ostalpha-domain-containing protein [Piptocephalis tieghemiana]